MVARRRQFLQKLGKGAVVFGVLGAFWGKGSKKARAEGARNLRPPFALAEAEFNAACVRCGQCVQACPYDTLRLASIFEPDLASGTPYFKARDIPCELCEDMPCVRACPSGALNDNGQDIYQSRMGVALISDQEKCLNWRGLRCDVCYRVCPVIDEAITLEMNHNDRTGAHAKLIPTVHSDACTGCGKCEKACVLSEAAIKVFHPEDIMGKQDDFYLPNETTDMGGES
ncbi:MAG: ferredoxin-type protein NapG [Alphaproteobacteria bacterium]